MSKRDAPHFITEYYTERGKVELMIPTDATDDDFALLRDMLDLIEAKFKRRADRKTEPQYSEDDMYWLSLAEDVANGKMSDAGANQAWLEYINHKDEPTGYNLSPVEDEPTISKMEQVEDEPQTEVDIARAIVHKMIDDSEIAEDAYPDLRQRLHDAVDGYEPQTERKDK